MQHPFTMAQKGNSRNTNQEQTNEAEIVDKKPPTNLFEFLTAEGLEDWPLPMSFENPLYNQSDCHILGTQDDISKLLEEAAPMKLHMLDEMEKRLSDLKAKLSLYANQIVTEDKKAEILVDNIHHSPSKTFMPERSASDAVKCFKEHKNVNLVDTLLQTRNRSLDYLKFPRFVHGEFIELPAKLEASLILHCVATAQTFNPGFEEDKDLLFDRIAHSYTALFTSINTDVKDKFLSIYPDCLSQALYCTYKESFPESKWRFNDDFKHYLVNLIYEWITGLHPVPGTWKIWNDEGLKLPQTSKEDDTTKKMLEAVAVNMNVNINLDMDAYTKVIEQLGTNDCDITPGHISQNSIKIPKAKIYTTKLEIGPGPEFEQVKFNISGCSPLIAHYLQMLQLQNDKQPGVKIRRSEIVKIPPEGPTYQQFIASTIDNSESLSKEYTRIREQTYADILELKLQQRDTNKEINKLKKLLISSKNAQERSLAIDAAIEYKERGQKGII